MGGFMALGAFNGFGPHFDQTFGYCSLRAFKLIDRHDKSFREQRNARLLFYDENNAPALNCQLVIDNPLPPGSAAGDSNLSEGRHFAEKTGSP